MKVLKVNQDPPVKEVYDEMEIYSIYTYEKISNLYKNFDTSFVQLIANYKGLLNQGYNDLF